MTISIKNDQETIKEPNRKYCCWLSGWTESVRPENWGNAPWKLQIAHIASGAGKARRVNDRRAVILLSPIAHDCHVSNSDTYPYKTINGVKYKTIDERHTLFIKQQFDPKYWDEDFLRSIWIGQLPTPEPPPAEWNKILLDTQGIIR